MKKLTLLFLLFNLFQHLCIAQCVPVSIVTQPQNQNDSIPGHAHFTVGVTGTAPYTYYWYVNGNVVDSTINSASGTNTYNTPPLMIADSNNTYYCVITNCGGAGSVTSTTVYLICIPVTISIQPLSQTFTAGVVTTISFSVTVNGTPPFSYYWYAGTNLVHTTIDTIGHTSVYSFYANPVVFGMNGNTYHVVITNHCSGGGGGGSALTSANAVLTVNCPTMAAPLTGYNSCGNCNGITFEQCSGASFILTTGAVAGATYQWTSSSGFSSSLQNPIHYEVNNWPCYTTITYSVTVTVNGCTSLPGTISAVIDEMPNPNVGPTVICSGAVFWYGVWPPSCGGLYPISISPQSCITISPYFFSNEHQDTLINTGTTPCSVTYSVTPVNNACIGSPYSFTVTVNPAPSVSITSPSICTGDTATITANGATSYTWSAGADSTGINTAGASPATTSTYTVTGTNTYGCHNTATSTVTVLSALNSTITQTADTLTSNIAGATYQWYSCQPVGMIPIAGAINQSYSPVANGEYAVAVTLGSCMDTSACVYFYSVGTNDASAKLSNLIISPNPATTSLTLTLSKREGTSWLHIYNVLGEMVFSTSLVKAKTEIDISNLPQGVYFAEASGEKKTIRIKFVKQ